VPIEDNKEMIRFKKGDMKYIINMEVDGNSKRIVMDPIFLMTWKWPNFL
jgi:hypothetical protein